MGYILLLIFTFSIGVVLSWELFEYIHKKDEQTIGTIIVQEDVDNVDKPYIFLDLRVSTYDLMHRNSAQVNIEFNSFSQD